MAGAVTVTRTQTHLDVEGRRYLEAITVAWTADASDGSVPDTVIHNVRGTLERLVTQPGSTAPTDNYDVTLTDADGFDVLGGAGADRDTANTEEAAIALGTYFQRTVAGDLTFSLANNSVNSATGTATLYVKR